MRLTIALAALGCVAEAASESPARVYALRTSQRDSPEARPSLPRQVVRLILQQRLAVDDRHVSLHDISDTQNLEEAVSHINRYGKPPSPLFSEHTGDQPSQLVILIEGLDAGQEKLAESSLGESNLAFAISDPPSAAAHQELLVDDFYAMGIKENACDFERAINPLDRGCWDGQSSIVRYDARKTPDVVQSLQHSAQKLYRLAEIGEMETTILLFPESSRNSKVIHWSSNPQGLRRRQTTERVMSDVEGSHEESHEEPSADLPPHKLPGAAQRAAAIPSCFSSRSACMTATGNCSSHGECRNRWNPDSESTEGSVCFACHCEWTVNPTGSKTLWAGSRCQKIDVSAPVALFAGTAILILLMIGGAIAVLFQVGEEKLPGVIGAGVSKSK